ncbi:EamA-like transporter family protein [Clostridium sp. P21]|uniref:EamA-like transporter family protein n=1 Tax=Clostridium muellerianum TaxID=2716538 RepID=A0A7Y0HN90_9CLOT|nr:DMT family transporter [Clostridium muellerianum]NMM61741.1 EamA-like transporter family protein [Clostridium muellerianum]
MILNIILALASGLTNVLGRIINSNLANKIGILPGTFYNYLTGLITSTIFFMFSSNTIRYSPDKFLSLPVYAYIGGALGVVVVGICSYITPKISALYATVLLFVGQLFAGIIVDYFTLHVLSTGKVVGGVLVLLGLVYNAFVDKNDTETAKNS